MKYNKTIIILFLVSLLSLGLIGCNDDYRTITGTIAEINIGNWAEAPSIKLTTDDGDIDFKCSSEQFKALNKGLKITITYSKEFWIKDVAFPSAQNNN